MPVFPSVEWFDAVRHEFNVNDAVRSGGGGMCDARVGVKVGGDTYLLVFEGFECSSASEIAESGLEDTDFYLDMSPDDWRDMIDNIRENGEADLDHSLNTMDLDSADGLAHSYTGDKYRQDMFFRYNQTFQYFFDQSARVETEFGE